MTHCAKLCWPRRRQVPASLRQTLPPSAPRTRTRRVHRAKKRCECVDAVLRFSMHPGFRAATKAVFTACTCTQQKACHAASEPVRAYVQLGSVRRSSARSVHSVGTTDSEALSVTVGLAFRFWHIAAFRTACLRLQPLVESMKRIPTVAGS